MLPRLTPFRATRQAVHGLLLGVTVLLASSCDEPSHPVLPTRTGAGGPSLTPGQGSTPTFIGQATYYHDQSVTRTTGDWSVNLEAKGGLEVIVRSFFYEPGSYTGWHKHPGPVLIQVVEGTVTFYEADEPCTPIVVRAGEGYLDTGEQGHIGRNENPYHSAKDVTIYLAPPGTQVSQLRIDMPAPPGAEACS